MTNFPDADKLWQVSFDGGTFPNWIGDEIFFINQRHNELMSVKVKINNDFIAEKPGRLFSANTARVNISHDFIPMYTISADGQNIIAIKDLVGEEQPFIVLVENWSEEFRNKK